MLIFILFIYRGDIDFINKIYLIIVWTDQNYFDFFVFFTYDKICVWYNYKYIKAHIITFCKQNRTTKFDKICKILGIKGQVLFSHNGKMRPLPNFSSQFFFKHFV